MIYVCPVTHLFVLVNTSAGSLQAMIVNRTMLELLYNFSIHSQELQEHGQVVCRASFYIYIRL